MKHLLSKDEFQIIRAAPIIGSRLHSHPSVILFIFGALGSYFLHRAN